MKQEELKQAIHECLKEIRLLKEQMEQTQDPLERMRLARRKKDLHYLQLWQIKKYQRI